MSEDFLVALGIDPTRYQQGVQNAANATLKLFQQLERTDQQIVKFDRTMNNAATATARLQRVLDTSKHNLGGIAGQLQLASTSLLNFVASTDRAAFAVASFSAAAAASFAKLVNSLVSAGNKYALQETQLKSLGIVVENFGKKADEAANAAKRLAEDGLVSIGASSNALKNLLQNDLVTIDQATELINRLKDAASANPREGVTLEDQILRTTEGIKMGLSNLTDNSGISTNLSTFYKRWADANDTTVAKMSEAQKQLAAVTGMIQEAAVYEGAASERKKTLLYAQDQLNLSFEKFAKTAGEIYAPAISAVMNGLRGVTDGVTAFAKAMPNLTGMLGGLSVVGTALAGAVGVVNLIGVLMAGFFAAVANVANVFTNFKDQIAIVNNAFATLNLSLHSSLGIIDATTIAMRKKTLTAKEEELRVNKNRLAQLEYNDTLAMEKLLYEETQTQARLIAIDKEKVALSTSSEADAEERAAAAMKLANLEREQGVKIARLKAIVYEKERVAELQMASATERAKLNEQEATYVEQKRILELEKLAAANNWTKEEMRLYDMQLQSHEKSLVRLNEKNAELNAALSLNNATLEANKKEYAELDLQIAKVEARTKELNNVINLRKTSLTSSMVAAFTTAQPEAKKLQVALNNLVKERMELLPLEERSAAAQKQMKQDIILEIKQKHQVTALTEYEVELARILNTNIQEYLMFLDTKNAGEQLTVVELQEQHAAQTKLLGDMQAQKMELGTAIGAHETTNNLLREQQVVTQGAIRYTNERVAAIRVATTETTRLTRAWVAVQGAATAAATGIVKAVTWAKGAIASLCTTIKMMVSDPFGLIMLVTFVVPAVIDAIKGLVRSFDDARKAQEKVRKEQAEQARGAVELIERVKTLREEEKALAQQSDELKRKHQDATRADTDLANKRKALADAEKSLVDFDPIFISKFDKDGKAYIKNAADLEKLLVKMREKARLENGDKSVIAGGAAGAQRNKDTEAYLDYKKRADNAIAFLQQVKRKQELTVEEIIRLGKLVPEVAKDIGSLNSFIAVEYENDDKYKSQIAAVETALKSKTASMQKTINAASVSIRKGQKAHAANAQDALGDLKKFIEKETALYETEGNKVTHAKAEAVKKGVKQDTYQQKEQNDRLKNTERHLKRLTDLHKQYKDVIGADPKLSGELNKLISQAENDYISAAESKGKNVAGAAKKRAAELRKTESDAIKLQTAELRTLLNDQVFMHKSAADRVIELRKKLAKYTSVNVTPEGITVLPTAKNLKPAMQTAVKEYMQVIRKYEDDITKSKTDAVKFAIDNFSASMDSFTQLAVGTAPSEINARKQLMVKQLSDALKNLGVSATDIENALKDVAIDPDSPANQKANKISALRRIIDKALHIDTTKAPAKAGDSALVKNLRGVYKQINALLIEGSKETVQASEKQYSAISKFIETYNKVVEFKSEGTKLDGNLLSVKSLKASLDITENLAATIKGLDFSKPINEVQQLAIVEQRINEIKKKDKVVTNDEKRLLEQLEQDKLSLRIAIAQRTYDFLKDQKQRELDLEWNTQTRIELGEKNLLKALESSTLAADQKSIILAQYRAKAYEDNYIKPVMSKVAAMFPAMLDTSASFTDKVNSILGDAKSASINVATDMFSKGFTTSFTKALEGAKSTGDGIKAVFSSVWESVVASFTGIYEGAVWLWNGLNALAAGNPFGQLALAVGAAVALTVGIYALVESFKAGSNEMDRFNRSVKEGTVEAANLTYEKALWVADRRRDLGIISADEHRKVVLQAVNDEISAMDKILEDSKATDEERHKAAVRMQELISYQRLALIDAELANARIKYETTLKEINVKFQLGLTNTIGAIDTQLSVMESQLNEMITNLTSNKNMSVSDIVNAVKPLSDALIKVKQDQVDATFAYEMSTLKLRGQYELDTEEELYTSYINSLTKKRDSFLSILASGELDSTTRANIEKNLVDIQDTISKTSINNSFVGAREAIADAAQLVKDGIMDADEFRNVKNQQLRTVYDALGQELKKFKGTDAEKAALVERREKIATELHKQSLKEQILADEQYMNDQDRLRDVQMRKLDQMFSSRESLLQSQHSMGTDRKEGQTDSEYENDYMNRMTSLKVEQAQLLKYIIENGNISYDERVKLEAQLAEVYRGFEEAKTEVLDKELSRRQDDAQANFELDKLRLEQDLKAQKITQWEYDQALKRREIAYANEQELIRASNTDLIKRIQSEFQALTGIELPDSTKNALNNVIANWGDQSGDKLEQTLAGLLQTLNTDGTKVVDAITTVSTGVETEVADTANVLTNIFSVDGELVTKLGESNPIVAALNTWIEDLKGKDGKDFETGVISFFSSAFKNVNDASTKSLKDALFGTEVTNVDGSKSRQGGLLANVEQVLKDAKTKIENTISGAGGSSGAGTPQETDMLTFKTITGSTARARLSENANDESTIRGWIAKAHNARYAKSGDDYAQYLYYLRNIGTELKAQRSNFSDQGMVDRLLEEAKGQYEWVLQVRKEWWNPFSPTWRQHLINNSKQYAYLTDGPGFASGGLIPDTERFNGIPATVHKGEMILPRDITQPLIAAIKSGTFGGAPIIVHVNNPIVREEQDIDKIVDRMERKVLREVNSQIKR